MASDPLGAPLDRFLETAEAVAASRSDVDVELAREVFHEAATLLRDGLVLDGLDEHDAGAVVAGLCAGLVTEDPGAAVRHRAQSAVSDPGELHDPEGVAAAYLSAMTVLQL